MKKRKKHNKKTLRITTADYLKALKKANREIELSESVGWKSVQKTHKSKKQYSRKENKKINPEE